jgi:glycine/D-amino acid oxidase-like deaminating enzyme
VVVAYMRIKTRPQTLDLTTGFYCFPPNPDGIMKLAIHADGYVNTSNPPDPKSTNEGSAQSSGISAPRTILTPGAADGFIPKRQVQILRHELSKVFPRLAEEKDFVATRLCWYTDTPDSNWLIDWHPEMDGLLLATAGCGHAFKVSLSAANRNDLEISHELKHTTFVRLAVLAQYRPRDSSPNRRNPLSRIRPQMEV